MKKILVLLIAAMLCNLFTSSAQTTVTIGTGTSVNGNNAYPCPYGNFFWGAKHDLLILASELTNLGVAPGDITAIAFNVTAMNFPTTLLNFSIGMKATSQTTATTAFANGLTTVLPSGTYPVSIGWNTHTLTTPFFWDGTSNLLIQTCFNNNGFLNSNPSMTYTTTSFQSVSSFRQDNSTTVCNALTGTASANRPNMRITYTPSSIPPVTKFGANVTNTCQNTVQFKDSSCCLVSSWAWDFGDTTAIDTTQNPTHTYAHPGVYTITLITSNSFGSDTLVKTNYLTISSGGATAASCNPTSATPFGGFGLTSVQFNTINSISAAGNTGYEDFACIGFTDVYEGSAYTLSLSSTGSVTQNFRAWIDFNNDGVFSNATETILSVNSAIAATTSVFIPVGAVLNTPLRMRVAADSDFSVNIPAPCSTYDFGQAEDYSVTILQNTNPPLSNFTVDAPVTCSGNVVFTDLSTNSPSTWDWDFGDNTTSQSQNPAHSYTASGTYTVTLITTNAFGGDTLIKTAYVNVTLGAAPIAPSCSPSTTLYCCGYGVYNVTYASINNPSGAASEGYQDFTCIKSTEVTEGFANLLSVETGISNAQDTRVWIDYNNDGSFGTTELVLTSNNQYNPSVSLTIPTGVAVLNTPLRMRVWTDFAGSTPGACNNPNRGQVEDYTVIVKPNTALPIAEFSADITISCGGLVNFTDATTNLVTAWEWNFGDSSPISTQQNPTHQYTATGIYTVTLIASSIYGADTLVKTAYINVVSTSPGPISPSCSPATTGYCCGVGIYNVTFSTLNNSTNDGVDGYSDYSCLLQGTVMAGLSYPISITTGPIYNENVRVWIDYNNDGVFNTSNEVAYTDLNHLASHTGNINIPSTAVTNVPLRMRITSDNSNPLTTACTQAILGQTEDYGITIQPNSNPPTAGFTANTLLTCNGVVSFTNTSSNATSQVWDFGDASATSTQANPTHTYTSSGNYTVTLMVYNSNGGDTLAISNYITVTLGNGPINAACSPITTNYCCNNGIYNVTMGTINNTTAGGSDSYKDYSCSIRDTTLDGGLPTSISVTTGAGQAENVRVYIDYNNNGNFNTPNELVYANNSLLTHTGIINVPATGVVFYTNLRMRVMSDFINITNACGNVTYGQVEDYTVFIRHTLATNDLAAGESLQVFPNPSSGNFQLNYSFEGNKELTIEVKDVLGRTVLNKNASVSSNYSETLDMSSFAKGIYILKILSDKQQITRKITLE